MTRLSPRPAGFTLVEMLVAIAIAVALMALAIGVTQSGAFDSYKITGAADKLSQHLLTAKQRAQRDRAPRGLRMVIKNPADPELKLHVKELAFIEQPSAWVAPPGVELVIVMANQSQTVTMGVLQSITNVTDKRVIVRWPNTPAFAAVLGEFEVTTNPATPNIDAAVRVGDVLLVPELGCAQRILEILPLAPRTYDMSALYFNAVDPFGIPLGSLGTSLATGTPPPYDGRAIPSTVFTGVELILGPTEAQRLNTFPASGANFSDRLKDPTDTTTWAWTPTYLLQSNAYSFSRQPRPLLGEPTIQMPSGAVVDFSTIRPNPMNAMSPLPIRTSLNPPGAKNLLVSTMPVKWVPQYYDILFSPSGQVMTSTALEGTIVNAADGLMALLVRDGDTPNVLDPLGADYDAAGDMILVCIYTRTGSISTQRANPPSKPPAATDDPFKFVKDGINTGL